MCWCVDTPAITGCAADSLHGTVTPAPHPHPNPDPKFLAAAGGLRTGEGSWEIVIASHVCVYTMYAGTDKAAGNHRLYDPIVK